MTAKPNELLPCPVTDASELRQIIAQYRIDLSSAHAEICKLQDLDPATHSWPDWTPQANTLRWLGKIEASMNTASTIPTDGDAELVASLVEALKPFARLQPGKQYNAGAYSIRFDDIRRAQTVLAKIGDSK